MTRGQVVEDDRTKDEIIATLQEQMKRLEMENAAYQAQTAAAAVDSRRIDALEATISQFVTRRSSNSGGSMRSNNPFTLLASREDNLSTPTPVGPRAGRFETRTQDNQEEAIRETTSDQALRSPPLLADDRQLRESGRRASIQVPYEGNSLYQPRETRNSASNIKLSEVPKFTGPTENPAALFNWRRLIEQYFALKNITDDNDRRTILGSVLVEARAGAWFVNAARDLKDLSWDEVMHELAVETLPTGWLEDTEKAIRQLKMGANEDFKVYVGRARDLYNMVQVQTSISPRNLAEYIVWGTPDVFQRWVKDRGLLHGPSFKMLPFVSAASNIWDVISASQLLPRQRTPYQPPSQRTANPASAQAGDSRTADQRADSAWRYHEYMRQQGLCGYCRTSCGNPQCRGPAKGAYVSVPESFNPGPRPVRRQEGGLNPWVKPVTNAPAKTVGPPGAPTAKPAGRGAASSTLVASVNLGESAQEHQPLFDQEVARYEEADRILVAHLAHNKDERYADIPSSRTKSIVLKMKINGLIVRALIDCAAETNLMSDRLNRRAGIPRRPLVAPVEVKLAIEDNDSKSFFF